MRAGRQFLLAAAAVSISWTPPALISAPSRAPFSIPSSPSIPRPIRAPTWQHAGVGQDYKRPSSRARSTASRLRVTPNLRYSDLKCALTVLTETYIWAAISWFVNIVGR
jgi:hypothetical protein